MNRPSGLVIGTAGHIDHGKTSLIRALTGIDTDRLAEEKRRGISIDLGFAHLTLPNGCSVSFIDVPGHERFIRNMLAGAGGIEAVMLIVAANESVMPQTREHFDICRLLGIQQGLVVLTKTDLASSEQIATAREDVQLLCSGSFLDGAPMVEVSSRSGAGIAEVINQLTALSVSSVPPQSAGLARLPIDRSFSLTGFGTVVTGTLLAGQFEVGENVHLHPSGKQLRIRGIQVHGNTVDRAHAGQRTAINLVGLESSEIERGHVLTHVGKFETTQVLDASIEWLGSKQKVTAREEVFFHIGAAEHFASLKILRPAKGNGAALARLWLSTPTVAIPGDRFILRRPSPGRTIAGGSIIDPFPPVRLNRAKTIGRLAALANAGTAARIQILVEESADGRSVGDLTRATGYEGEHIVRLVETNAHLFFHQSTQRAFSKAWLGDRRTKLLEWLHAFHVQHPLAQGAPIAAARLGLEPGLASVVIDRFSAVRVQGEMISLATYTAVFSDGESNALVKIESAFRKAGYQPPGIDDVLRAALPDSKKGRSLLESLVKNKKLVRVSEDLIFHSDVIAHVRNSLSVHKGRRFSIPEFKEWTQMSRKYAIPVLEYLDREKVTRREGDQRVIV